MNWLKRLNEISTLDNTWVEDAEYRFKNRDRLMKEAKEKLIELRKKANNYEKSRIRKSNRKSHLG